MLQNSKISVALCTYNGEKYIEEQLQSILNQTRVPDEIVICDDGSSDQTVSVARAVLEASGVSYRIEVNAASLGVADNFLKALKMTTGDWVFTCDQDDVWNSDKVEVFLNKARQGSASLFFSNGNLVDGKGYSLNCTLWDAYGIRYESLVSSPLFLQIIRSPVVTGAAMMVSRELIDSVDRIPKPFLHDEWLSILASVKNGAVPIDEATFSYRQHGKNVVGAKKRSLFERIRRWSDGFRSLRFRHHDRRMKAEAVFKVASGTEYATEGEDYLSFWKALDAFSSYSCLQGIKTSFRLYREGKYNRYYTGIRGWIGDVISLCFY